MWACLSVRLFVCFLDHLSVCVRICLSVRPSSVCLCACPSVSLPVGQPVFLPACLSASMPACLPACQHACLSASLSLCQHACQPACLRACACVCVCVRVCVLHNAFYLEIGHPIHTHNVISVGQSFVTLILRL